MVRASSLLSIGAVLLVLGASASAAPTWTSPREISAGDRALGPELALNAAGEGLVVWDHEVGSDCATAPASLSCIHIVEAAVRARGSDTWQTPVEVARPGIGSGPRAAVDPAGDAAIVWVHDIGRDRVLQATYRRGPSGAWPEPNDLSDPSLEVRNHHVALDAAGNAVAVWADGANGAVQAEVRSATTGVWGAPVRLSSPQWATSGGPRLALTPSGRAVVAWVERGDVIRVSRGDLVTGTWEPSIDFSGSPARVDGDPQIAINAAGDAAVVWIRRATGTNDKEVQAAYRPRTGDWGPPFSLGNARTASAATPQVAVAGSGSVVATWLSPGGVEFAVRSIATGLWKASVVASAPRTASDLRLAMDTSGNAVAVWTSGENGVVQAAIRPGASGEWQPRSELSSSGAYAPRVALDAAGHAVAIWNRGSSQRVVVESVDLDGSGPVLAHLTVPKRAVVRGVRARFSVQPVPWATPLAGEPRWDFGDGGSATGRRVAHAYMRTGRYGVSVSQTDAARGVSTSTAIVTVIGARLRNRRPPSIRGAPRVGNTLTCLRGLWTGSPPIRFSYSWRRDGQVVPDARRRRYRLGRRDGGSLIACEVEATNPAGSARAISAVVGVER